MYHNLFDSHIHSDNSHDGHHSVMYMAERAQSMGLTGIAITDHADCHKLGQPGYMNRILQSIYDVAKAKAAFRHRMTFGVGIEIGVDGHSAAADKLLKTYSFDFVLGAIHHTKEGNEYCVAPYDTNTPEQNKALLDGYFETMMEMVEWGGFDSLAHLNYPWRSASRLNVTLDMEPHKEQIDVILKGLVEKGKALEVNTSGLRSPLGEMLPSLWILRRFRELGGEYITIGSDAHVIDHVGYGIPEAMDLLRHIGFEYFAFYRARQPIMLRIV
ncbi:MAG TPA: histidinol-phosphatase HisJ family protein [Clostridiales bacterium]|nr:histidinol-phosphatase HisJ family protein [Clostridiales bacterium]